MPSGRLALVSVSGAGRTAMIWLTRHRVARAAARGGQRRAPAGHPGGRGGEADRLRRLDAGDDESKVCEPVTVAVISPGLTSIVSGWLFSPHAVLVG